MEVGKVLKNTRINVFVFRYRKFFGLVDVRPNAEKEELVEAVRYHLWSMDQPDDEVVTKKFLWKVKQMKQKNQNQNYNSTTNGIIDNSNSNSLTSNTITCQSHGFERDHQPDTVIYD